MQIFLLQFSFFFDFSDLVNLPSWIRQSICWFISNLLLFNCSRNKLATDDGNRFDKVASCCSFYGDVQSSNSDVEEGNRSYCPVDARLSIKHAVQLTGMNTLNYSVFTGLSIGIRIKGAIGSVRQMTDGWKSTGTIHPLFKCSTPRLVLWQMQLTWAHVRACTCVRQYLALAVTPRAKWQRIGLQRTLRCKSGAESSWNAITGIQ